MAARAVRAVPGSACKVVKPASTSRIDAGHEIVLRIWLILVPLKSPAVAPVTVLICAFCAKRLASTAVISVYTTSVAFLGVVVV